MSATGVARVRDLDGNYVTIPVDDPVDPADNFITQGDLEEALANLPGNVPEEVVNNFVTNIANNETFITELVSETFITELTQNVTYEQNFLTEITELTEITQNTTYITNLVTQIVAQINGKKGIANELATLDGSGKLTSSQIPSSLATDAEVAAGYQPLDSDLTSIAALSTTSFGRSLLALADAAALLSAAGAAASSHTHTKTRAIEFVIDGGGAAIATGVKGDLQIPFACTITAARLLADQSGSIVVNVWKDTYANFPPVVGDKITASAPPTISSATKSEDSTLTGWTTSISAGDILRFNVDSATTITKVTIVLVISVTD